jgi:type I restriction enzyme R subunit
MPAGFTESDAEEAALGWLETLGYTIKHGPEIAYNVDGGERTDEEYRDTILQNRLHEALKRLNLGLPRGRSLRRLPKIATGGGHGLARPQPCAASYAR